MTSPQRLSVLRISCAVMLGAAVVAARPAMAQRAPAAASVNLPADVLSLVCSPTLTYEAPPTPLRITGSQESTVHRILAPGDLITINAGTDNGITIGQEYYTRRAVPTEKRPIGRTNPATIRTSGWIRIYAADTRMSLATIVYACDSVELSDYLEPFVLPVVPVPSTSRPAAQRGNYGRVLTGNDGRATFATGDYFVVDRGSNHGVAVGTRFVVYRDKREPGHFLFEIGEAVAVEVGPGLSTLQAMLARDAFTSGDYVALRK